MALTKDDRRATVSQFTEEVATALLRAIDMRKGDLDHRVTAGIWIEPTKPPIGVLGPGTDRPRIVPLSEAEISRLGAAEPISKESIGRLNDRIAGNPQVGLRLLRTLGASPTAWRNLFSLREDQEHELERSDLESSSQLNALVEKLAQFSDELVELVFEVNTLSRSAAAKKASDKPWYVPDKFEISGTGKNGGYEVKATITWEF